MTALARIVHSASFYPITLLYLTGVGLGMLLARGVLTWVVAVLIFGLVAILGILYAQHRELKTVHKLVDGQRTELLARIDQLVELLIDSGVVVPPTGQKEQDARDQNARMSAEAP